MRDFRQIAQRIISRGWHIKLQIDSRDITDAARMAAEIGIPIVIGHFGFPDLSAGPDGEDFAAMVDIAARGGCLVKMSAPYRLRGLSHYEVLDPFIRRLVEEASDALLWGLDWPHTECSGLMPDDGELVELVESWLQQSELRRKVLVENAAAFYWGDEEWTDISRSDAEL
ncbi:amidohydrolase family protein [Pseudochelatococcus sp. B33]